MNKIYIEELGFDIVKENNNYFLEIMHKDTKRKLIILINDKVKNFRDKINKKLNESEILNKKQEEYKIKTYEERFNNLYKKKILIRKKKNKGINYILPENLEE